MCQFLRGAEHACVFRISAMLAPLLHAVPLLPAQCHLLGNGYSEVALTFGRGHTCGTAPERVANQIRDSVAARAAAYPECFRAGSLVPPPPRPPPPPAAPPPPPAQGTW